MKNNKIIIQREKEFFNVIKSANHKKEGSTIGLLTIYDKDDKNIFECYTLENEGESTDKSGQDKRILADDDYYLDWTLSRTNGGLAKKMH